jgi:hypothetical protein
MISSAPVRATKDDNWSRTRAGPPTTASLICPSIAACSPGIQNVDMSSIGGSVPFGAPRVSHANFCSVELKSRCASASLSAAISETPTIM